MSKAERQFALDSSVILDFHKVGLLDTLFSLPFAFVVTNLITEDLDEPDLQTLINAGVRVEALDGPQFEAVADIADRFPDLSIYDSSLLWWAKLHSVGILTGDKPLRLVAHSQKVLCHGSIWLLEQLIARGTIPRPEAAVALSRMLSLGRRLPVDECKKRIAEWERG